jgi:2-polyprenyl-3-methyl-5-hydroxy-6-metoxy-1,4-benzoquinol methylase
MSPAKAEEQKISQYPFGDLGSFFGWWLRGGVLRGEASRVFEDYYSNYIKEFNGYLRQAWVDRHLELEETLLVLGEKSKTKVKILDLGCGTGTVSLYCAVKLGERAEVLGVDIKEKRLTCARERQAVLERKLGKSLSCKYELADVRDLRSERQFDLIYLEEALHHMEPRLPVCQKIADLLGRGGVLIISEVNAFNPFIQLWFLGKRGFQTVKENRAPKGHKIPYGNERILTANRVIRLFRSQGLRLKSVRYFRIADVRTGKFADARHINLMKLEKAFCKTPFLRSLLTIHYNIVLKRA